MRGRVYDPYLQRFISADPIVDGLDTSQGLNRYGYVQNNPLSRWDPTGFESEGIPEITVERWRYLGAAGVGGGGGGRNSIADPSDIDKAARRAEATHRKAKAKAERQAKEKKEIRARQCHAAISNAFAGGVSAATFFSLGGSPQFAPEAFLGGFIVGGVGGFFSEVGGGGFNAAIVTTFASVVTRVPNGSRMSEFVGALGDGANAATPLGALTIPTGSVVGVATKFFEASRGVSSFGLGAVGTTAVGLNAGAFAATVGIATSSLLDVSGIPEWLCN